MLHRLRHDFKQKGLACCTAVVLSGGQQSRDSTKRPDLPHDPPAPGPALPMLRSQAMLLVPGKSGGSALLPNPSGLVMDALSLPAAEPKGQAPGQPLPQCSVQLLLSLGCAPAAGPAGVSGVQGLGVSSSNVQGQVVLRGGVHGVAYVHRREAISKAAEGLKVRAATCALHSSYTSDHMKIYMMGVVTHQHGCGHVRLF